MEVGCSRTRKEVGIGTLALVAASDVAPEPSHVPAVPSAGPIRSSPEEGRAGTGGGSGARSGAATNAGTHLIYSLLARLNNDHGT